jgi:hypothetical protein
VLETIGLFLLLFLVSLTLIGAVIVLLPRRHFVDDRRFLAGQPPLIRWPAIFIKNLFGLALVIVGVLLSIPGIPGQGLLTILLGLLLLDIPYKRRLIAMLLRRPRVKPTINGLRRWFGRPPLEFPENP